MLSEALDGPHALVRVVTLLLFIGAPVAALLAWYHGDKTRHRISGIELTLLTILLAIGGGIMWLAERRGEPAVHQTAVELARATPPAVIPLIPDKSVAVMSFVDMSEKHDQEYFSDGLAEELIDLLTRVPDLHIPARTSSFFFKDRQATIPDIARALGVAHILEGSVRKVGNHVRITAQLVRADNGYHLWSNTYDRDFKDVFAIQDDIARVVVQQLKATLLGAAPVTAGATHSPEAHNLYMRARFLADHDTDSDLLTAIALYQQALQLDPKFAAAWASLSLVYARRAANGYADVAGEYAKLDIAANQALKLDPSQGDAYSSVAQRQMSIDEDWVAAAATIAKGRQMDPANTALMRNAAVLAVASGQPANATVIWNQVLERDPLNLVTRRYLGRTFLYAGQLKVAETTLRQVIAMDPQLPGAHYELGRVLLTRGDASAAVQSMEAENSNWRALGLPMA